MSSGARNLTRTAGHAVFRIRRFSQAMAIDNFPPLPTHHSSKDTRDACHD